MMVQNQGFSTHKLSSVIARYPLISVHAKNTYSYKVMFIYMHIYAMRKLAPFTNTNTQLEEHKQDFAQDYLVYV